MRHGSGCCGRRRPSPRRQSTIGRQPAQFPPAVPLRLLSDLLEVADLLAALPVAAAAAVVIAGAVAAAVAGAGAIVGENLAIDFNHNFDNKKENFF
jgi:hypothetical protein